MSITSMGYTKQRMDAGAKLPGPWLIDAGGNATDDPRVAWVGARTLLPLGGLDAGHKGYALALLIEACTGALAGFGRADPPEGWGATVFVQVLDPEAFGGRAEFLRQVDFVAAAAHGSKPRPGVERVRLPGEGGLARYREQQANGVALYPAIMPDLAPWAAKLGVPPPPART
jgi:L-lactate dehydrogenase